ncbi:uncharacterized protein V1510DRAFT_417201 [Dipodascopsis tothii]|uniref:uncharacterized protein n=1 Tax=Dipodascopsis tothii TaxID=44089 RepID=UPI0034CEA349
MFDRTSPPRISGDTASARMDESAHQDGRGRPGVLGGLQADIRAAVESADGGVGRERICGLCRTKYGRYSCPRCQTLYCSLECYRRPAHRLCIDSFEREKAAALAATGAADSQLSNDDKRALHDLVQQYELDAAENPLGDLAALAGEGGGRDGDGDGDSDSDSDDDGDDSAGHRQDLRDRLAGVDVDAADFDDLWARLTVAEQADFIRLAQEHGAAAHEAL